MCPDPAVSAKVVCVRRVCVSKCFLQRVNMCVHCIYVQSV